MRTTLTLDEDLAARLAELARERREPFKAVVNEALRRGLGELAPRRKPFRCEGHPGGLRPGIDPRGFNELIWDLEAERLRR